MAFPATGTLTYNGYEFPAQRHVTCEVRTEYDEANRVAACLITTLRVEFTVTSTSSTDNSLEDIRHTLSQPGKVLYFTGEGFGSLVVNTGAVNDLRWGPKPRMLSWKPEGSTRACTAVWEVEVCTSACDSPGALLGGGIMEFNFSVAFARDKFGDVTRTVTGHLRIAQVRRPGTKLVYYSADDYLTRISPECPLGFQRTQFDRTHSPDKTRLDFTIVDEQIKSRNAYPAKVIQISGTQEVQWGRKEGPSLRSLLSMDIVMEAGLYGVTAWGIFARILKQRMLTAKRLGLTVLLDSMAIREDIFGRSNSFQAGFRIICSETDNVFQKMISGTGLFTRTQTDWTTWRNSLGNSMFSALGTAGLRLNASDDQLVDACGSNFVLTLPAPQQQFPYQYPPGEPLKNDMPPANKSYVYYQGGLEPTTKTPVAVHYPLQNYTPVESGTDFNYPESARSSTQPFGFAPLGGGAMSNSIHQRGVPSNETRFKGAAVRAGYPIPRPKVSAIGDQQAVEKEGSFKLTQHPSVFGVPIYSAAWDILYLTDRPPSNLMTPPVITDVA